MNRGSVKIFQALILQIWLVVAGCADDIEVGVAKDEVD